MVFVSDFLISEAKRKDKNFQHSHHFFLMKNFHRGVFNFIASIPIMKVPKFSFIFVMVHIRHIIWTIAKTITGSTISRLNSGNFGIFYASESIYILNSSACRALKIISNDSKIGTISWDLKGENRCFNFCVGQNVGGFSYRLSNIFNHLKCNWSQHGVMIVCYIIIQARLQHAILLR